VRPISVTQTGAGVSAPIVLDYTLNPFSVTLDVVISGTVSSQLQGTNDDPFDPAFNPATANWFNIGAAMTATPTAPTALGPNPTRAVRVNQASGSGSTTLRVIQAGTRSA
jgi:hypothetical protein